MATATKDKAQTPESIVRRGFELLAAHDLDALAAMWTDETVYDYVAVGVFRGPEEIRSQFAELIAAVPDFEIQIRHLAAEGDRVFVEWRASGTFTGGRFQGIDPNGSHVELRGVDNFELRDGKVAHNTIYYDGMEFARSIGMLPRQGSGGERAMLAAFNAATKLRSTVREALDR